MMVTKNNNAFDVVAVATDVVIFTVQEGKLQVLLIAMKKKPFSKHWAIPGGMVQLDESVEVAAQRHLASKTGVSHAHLEQVYTFGEVDRDPFGRVASAAYMALIPGGNVTLQTTGEYAGVAWFPVKKLPAMAYDHKHMLRVALDRLRGKLSYTNIVYSLLSKEFTMADLQGVYEVILNKPFDKRNFQRKILSLGLVRRLRKQRRGGAHRPAALYSFVKRSPQEVDIL